MKKEKKKKNQIAPKSSTLEYSMIEAPKKNPPPKEASHLSYLYVLRKKKKKKIHIFFSAQSAVLFLKVGLHLACFSFGDPIESTQAFYKRSCRLAILILVRNGTLVHHVQLFPIEIGFLQCLHGKLNHLGLKSLRILKKKKKLGLKSHVG